MALVGDSLGTIANIASGEVETASKVVLKFLLQDESARLLPGEKVERCLRHLAPVNETMGRLSPVYNTVEVHYDSETNRAGYRNLIVCDRVWICPVCASRVTEIRRQAITTALDTSGLFPVLATFTLQHNKHETLTDVLNRLLKAYRKFKAGRWWSLFVKEWGWIGDIRALEITYGDNGWHPHIHSIMCFDTLLSETHLRILENTLKMRFQHVLGQVGGFATWEHGVNVKDDESFTREYIAKFGKLPETNRKPDWTVTHELTKATSKLAKTPDGATPWQLLLQSAEGDKESGRLFQVYAKAIKGHNQLVWSRGFRDRLHMREIEQEQETRENIDNYLFELGKNTWFYLVRQGLRGELLRVVKACNGDLDTIDKWLSAIAPGAS